MFSFFTQTTYTKVTVVEEFDNAKYATKPVSDPHPTHAQVKATPTPPTMCTDCLVNESKCMVATMGKLGETEHYPYEWSQPTQISCCMLARTIALPQSSGGQDGSALD